jgi:cell division septation protein DedD
MRLTWSNGGTARCIWPRHARGGTLLGVVIGFALGLGVAAVIAYVLTKTPNPFEGKGAKPDVANPHLSSVEREAAKQGDRPRFDFSKILPGTEEHKTQKEDAAVGQAGDKSAAVVPIAPANEQSADKGKYFLQAGAYQNVADAEDQRAKLALMGIEASMQTVTVPDKGTLNRVRLGPYGTADEMNQVKSELLKRGVPTAVIRNP